MGYSSLENYRESNLAYFNTLQNMITENPEIKLLEKEQQHSLFIELFSDFSQNRNKSFGDCTYDYSYCSSMAKGTYYAGSGACALGLAGGPIGVFGAIACQLVNTSYYENSKAECLRSFERCEE